MKLEEAIKSSRFSDEQHKATINILYTAYWLKHSFSTVIKAEDITLEQFNVLRILRGMHPKSMCVKDIASRMIEKSSNVPRIIDRLLLKELVVRNPSTEDKRETLVLLTEKGCTLLERASLLVQQTTDEITGLDEAEAKMLNNLLEKLRESQHGNN